MGLLPVIYAIKPVLTLLNRKGFNHLRRITADLSLGPLLERQPRFHYKYLVPFAAASFDRRTRLHVLINHYECIKARTNLAYFEAMNTSAVIWRQRIGPDECTISLSYPLHVFNEAEVSLHFSWNSTLTQVVSFVIAPGTAVGAPTPHVMLFGQVQGFANAALLKEVTKALHDITPAVLLVHAAYGIATALQLGGAAGVTKDNKVGKWENRYFDYNAFWLDLKGELNAQGNTYLLPVPPPERPIEEYKRNHRARTLRKRQFKESIREEVARYWQQAFCCDQAPVPPAASYPEQVLSGQLVMA